MSIVLSFPFSVELCHIKYPVYFPSLSILQVVGEWKMKCDDLSNELDSSQKECRSQGRQTDGRQTPIAFAWGFVPFQAMALLFSPFFFSSVRKVERRGGRETGD